MPIITRKIQIIPQGDTEAKNATWQTFRDYADAAYRMANMVSTHQYIQQNLSQFGYFTEEFKVKLADINKDSEGVLNTSSKNTTYRLLSAKYKGEIPSRIYSDVNGVVANTINKERKDYFSGKKSLRNYRKGMPFPASKKELRGFEKVSKGNYTFTLFNCSFKTFFGRDRSGNKILVERMLKGEIDLCDSSIQIKDKKMFLLLVLKVASTKNELIADKELIASLNPVVPITFKVGKKAYEIGTKEEFLYRRLQIQAGLKRLQESNRFNNGGKGRAKKTQALDRYHLAEKNYIETKIHQYTAKLVNWCVRLKCGRLVLQEQKIKEEVAKETQMILRNWSYYGITEKLKYKCGLAGVTLVTQD